MAEFVIKSAKGVLNIPPSTVAGVNRPQINPFLVDICDVSVNDVDAVDRFAFFVGDGDVLCVTHVQDCVCQAGKTEKFGLIFLRAFDDCSITARKNDVGVAEGAELEEDMFIVSNSVSVSGRNTVERFYFTVDDDI